MTVAVLIPWRPTDEHRAAALAEVGRQLAAAHPAWPVHVGALDASEPWCKGRAVARALRQADPAADVLVIQDADVLPPTSLIAAVQAVETGAATWAVPHRYVRRLARHATEALIAGRPYSPAHIEPTHGRHRGVLTGGILVVARATYLDVGGFDQRFIGWGGEDLALWRTLTRLAGPPHVIEAELTHLWHPTDRPPSGAAVYPEARPLLDRYKAAMRDQSGQTMRDLVEEGKRCATA